MIIAVKLVIQYLYVHQRLIIKNYYSFNLVFIKVRLTTGVSNRLFQVF